MHIGLGLAITRQTGRGSPPAFVNTVAPAVTGTPTEGQLLSVSNGSWTPAPAGYTYQWYRNGVAIGSATANTYTLVDADGGTTIYARVTANDGGSGTTSAQSNTVGPIAQAEPQNTSIPTISGTTTEGETLTAGNGSWTNSPSSFTYQWTRDNVDIGGATSGTYLLVSADVGTQIRVVVTASNASGAGPPATSNPTAAIAAGGLWTPTNLTGKALWYDASDASTITIATGVSQWNDKSGNSRNLVQATTSKQPTWNSVDTITTDGVNDLLVSSTFDMAAALDTNIGGIFAWVGRRTSGIVNMGWYDTGASLRLAFEGASRVDWPNDGSGKLEGWSATLSSSVFKICLVRKQVGGSLILRMDGTQVASNSAFNAFTPGETDLFYVGGAPYGDAFSAAIDVKEIVLTSLNDLTSIELLEGYLAWKYGLEGALPPGHPYKSAAPTVGGGVGVPVNTAIPVISGTTTEGEVLSTTTGTWTNSPSSYAYQWKNNGSNIGGATSSSYLLTAGDVGDTITVDVTATNGSGSSTPATSSGVGPISASSGSDILDADLATIQDADGVNITE